MKAKQLSWTRQPRVNLFESGKLEKQCTDFLCSVHANPFVELFAQGNLVPDGSKSLWMMMARSCAMWMEKNCHEMDNSKSFGADRTDWMLNHHALDLQRV